MSMIKQAMPVTKSEGGKRIPVGEVEIFIPDLAEFGFTEAPASIGEDGLPVYTKAEHNWLFSGVVAATKMQARNKLEQGSIKIKDGQAIAATLADLMVESERGGNGEYLKAISQLKAKFGAWVGTLGKSQKAQDLLKTLFSNKQALVLQEKTNREKFAGYIADFAETLDAETLAAAGRYLEGLVAAATADTVEADDF